jgi:negative regulator of sigma E activity
MDPFFVRNRLSAYLDGDLEEAEAAEVSAAIARDPALQAEYEALRKTVQLLSTAGRIPAPEGFEARVMAKVAEDSGEGWLVPFRRFANRVPVELVALAAAAAVVSIAILARPSDQGERASDFAASQTPTDQTPPPVAAAAPKQAPTVPSNQSLDPKPPNEGRDDASAGGPPAPRTLPPTGAVPTSAYVPEWEQGGAEPPAAGNEPASEALHSYQGWRLMVSDPDALYRLASLATAAGGRVVGPGARPLTVEDNYGTLLLTVPAGSAASLEGNLRALGGSRSQAPDGVGLVDADQTGFAVEVQLSP